MAATSFLPFVNSLQFHYRCASQLVHCRDEMYPFFAGTSISVYLRTSLSRFLPFVSNLWGQTARPDQLCVIVSRRLPALAHLLPPLALQTLLRSRGSRKRSPSCWKDVGGYWLLHIRLLYGGSRSRLALVHFAYTVPFALAGAPSAAPRTHYGRRDACLFAYPFLPSALWISDHAINYRYAHRW